MTQPFYDRLNEYFTSVGQVLRGEAKAASIFPNTTDIGQSRELSYIEFLKHHIPSSCNVFLGGFLFNLNGEESNQLDVIITNDLCPRFDLNNPDGKGKSFSCVDGTIAVASIKSKLDTNQLYDALSNLETIPEKQSIDKRHSPNLSIPGYDDWPFKIIFAKDGISIDTIIESLNNFYRENPSIPFYKRPNLIHVVGKYNIIRANNEFNRLRNGTEIPEHSYHGIPNHTEAFPLFLQ